MYEISSDYSQFVVRFYLSVKIIKSFIQQDGLFSPKQTNETIQFYRKNDKLRHLIKLGLRYCFIIFTILKIKK